MKIEKLEGDDWVLWYTHAVYYKDSSDSTIKFMCVAKDELDAYQQAQQHRKRTHESGQALIVMKGI